MQEIKDINPEWAKRLGHKIIGKPPIMFVSTENEYNNLEKTKIFSVYLNLKYSITAMKENSSDLEKRRQEEN